jgi:hypothetical protein
MDGLVVSDTECLDYKAQAAAFADAIEDALERYLAILQATRATAITGGEVAERLDGYIALAHSLLRDATRILGYSAADRAVAFQGDIDSADETLYGGS